MVQAEGDQLGQTVMAAAERFAGRSGISLTEKRLLYEFLAFVGDNGKTLSGLCRAGVLLERQLQPDVVQITRKFLGSHCMKHYYVTRQFDELTGVVLSLLKALSTPLKKEDNLPADFRAQLDAAVQVAEQGAKELPHLMRIMRQPDVLNEAYSFRYQSRPWPLCHVPQTTEVKESSSRFWPADNEQHFHAWVSFASERCRVPPDVLQQVLDKVPVKLSVAAKTEGCWEVVVRQDKEIQFREWRGSKEYTVKFMSRAQDFLPGMVIRATFVTLSDGTHFMTDWGYVFPTFYAPYLTSTDDFGCYDRAELLY